MGDSGPRTESTLSFLRSNGVTSGGAGIEARTGLMCRGEMATLAGMLEVDCLRWWSTGTADILNSSGWARGCRPPLVVFVFLSEVALSREDGEVIDDGEPPEKRSRTSGLIRPVCSFSDEVESSELVDDEN